MPTRSPLCLAPIHACGQGRPYRLTRMHIGLDDLTADPCLLRAEPVRRPAQCAPFPSSHVLPQVHSLAYLYRSMND